VFSSGFSAAAWTGKPGFLSSNQLSLALTIHYATFFILGALLAGRATELARIFDASSRLVRPTLWLISLMLCAYPFDNPWTLGQRAAGDLLTGLGCVGLIGLALGIRSAALLRIGDWLGDISYSLYLNHFVVLNAVVIVLYASQPPALLWALTLVCSLALAVVMNRAVEHPARILSRVVRRAEGKRRSHAQLQGRA
jgi:peptidoglycan/LPS O-acetylase OafA/YrhL